MADYNYDSTAKAIDDYYNGDDYWQDFSGDGINTSDVESVLSSDPNIRTVKSNDGKVISYNFNSTHSTANSAAENVNSNIDPGDVNVEIPGNSTVQDGKVTLTSGMSTAGKFVFGEIVPALAATAAGITLGKTIDSLLYKANPDFWDEHGMSTINPDTWNSITSNDTFGGRVFNSVFGLNPDNSTQTYIDENALAYLTSYMGNNGFFDKTEYELENKSILSHPDIDYQVTPIYTGSFEIPRKDGQKSASFVISNNKSEVVCKLEYRSYRAYFRFYSRNSFTLITDNYTFNPYTINSNHGSALNDGSIIYAASSNFGIDISNYIVNFDYFPHDKEGNLLTGEYSQEYARDCSIIALFGTKTNISDIPNQTDAKQFNKTNISDWNDISSVLNALKEQYPELWQNAVTQNVPQPDGSTVTYTYVPVAMPDVDPEGNPIIGTSTQANPQVNPATAPESLLDALTKLIARNPDVNPPDTGTGTTPIVPVVTGSASALYAIYNPTLSEINSFGAWLWSDNFIEQIKKLFSDPMQAIIGLHKVFATPATGGKQNIKVGYLDSGVSANIVSNQYSTIDCGTVKMSEQFHNVFDYSPYTQVSLYLPFIGIVNLDVSDVMRSSINIVYHVDVFSGACLAEVKITRDSAGGTLYQYAGNASVTLPISSGSYMGIVASIASIAGGVAGTIASGGAAIPMLASAAGSALNARTRVEHSGSFSGNAGAMGSKKPYLIISRPQTALADNFNQYIGYPSNFTQKLSACKGYVKVVESHLENINATDSELSEIESLLKEGVLI